MFKLKFLSSQLCNNIWNQNQPENKVIIYPDENGLPKEACNEKDYLGAKVRTNRLRIRFAFWQKGIPTYEKGTKPYLGPKAGNDEKWEE